MEKFNVDFDYVIKRLERLNNSALKELDKNSISKLNVNSIKNKSNLEIISSADMEFLSRMKNALDSIPSSNGGRYYKKFNYNIGIICDEFLLESIVTAANFTYLNQENWQYELPKQDILLVVSTWQGLNKDWVGVSKEGSIKRDLVYEIIEKSKDYNKKVVFYSKEDPPNYYIYLDLAKKCDYIFTSCQEAIPNYKKDCENDKVYCLSFGINPQYHNPIGCKNQFKKDGVLFSGSWMEKYQERAQGMKMLFDGVLASGKQLKIIDRNFSIVYKNYKFPQEYWKYISPEVDHKTLQKLHKLYDWALNINTVTKSVSMFANRCYELQACGNLILSNYSVGVNSRLPLIFTVIDENEIPLIINSYDKETLYWRQMAGVRSVMTNETCFDRMEYFFNCLGLEDKQTRRSVLIVVDELTTKIEQEIKLQTYQEFEVCLKSNLNKQLKEKHDMITFLNSKYSYDVFYLEDLVNGFKYTNCDYITKDSYYNGDNIVIGIEHDYVNTIKNVNCALFWSDSFTLEQLITINNDDILNNGYSIDHFHVNTKIEEPKEHNQDLKFSIIVPVYNNGLHLLGKAFSSLYRSSMFGEMEILLIDDGSTDLITKSIVTFLGNKYKNIKTFLFPEGGSGSASRPRNKGHELVSCEYLTYLDPDDESIGDGYAKLYNFIIDKNVDLVIGNVIRLKDVIFESNLYKKFIIAQNTSNTNKELLINLNFIAINIQAMMFKKSIISNLTQIECAAGEDTIFGWELILLAKSISILNENIFIYYAFREGSVVNSINTNFFEKYYLVENPRRKMLEKNNLLQDYMKLKFNTYFENWTLYHLLMVDEENVIESTQIVYDIFKVYNDVYLNDSEKINTFIHFCSKNKYIQAVEEVRSLTKNGDNIGETLNLVDLIDVCLVCAVDGNNITADILITVPRKILKYAYYLFDASNNILQKQMYIKENTFTFKVNQKGSYYVKGFVLYGDNEDNLEKITRESKIIVV